MAVVVRDVLVRVKVQVQGATGGFGGGTSAGGFGTPLTRGPAGIGSRGGIRPGDVNQFSPSGASARPIRFFGPGGDPNAALRRSVTTTARRFDDLNKKLGGTILEIVNLATWSRAVTRVTFGIRGAGLVGAVPGAALGLGAAAIAGGFTAAALPGQGRAFRSFGRFLGRQAQDFGTGFAFLRQQLGGRLLETRSNQLANISVPLALRAQAEQRERLRLEQARLDSRLARRLGIGVTNRIGGAFALQGITGGTEGLNRINSELNAIQAQLNAGGVSQESRLGLLTIQRGLRQQEFGEVSRLATAQVDAERQKLNSLQRQVALERQKAETIQASIRSSAISFLQLNPGQQRILGRAAERFREGGLPRGRQALLRLERATQLDPELRERFAQELVQRFRGDREFEALTGAERRGAAARRAVRRAEEEVQTQEQRVANSIENASDLLRQAADALDTASEALLNQQGRLENEQVNRETARASRAN